MNDLQNSKKRDFLYSDENVNYTVINNGNDITIHCDHPVFINRFKNDTVTLTLKDFFNTLEKGKSDYKFFESFKISLQEDFLDNRS